jgi:hypothetical protein
MYVSSIRSSTKVLISAHRIVIFESLERLWVVCSLFYHIEYYIELICTY